jgi:inosine/xanthosine triphosphatase
MYLSVSESPLTEIAGRRAVGRCVNELHATGTDDLSTTGRRVPRRRASETPKRSVAESGGMTRVAVGSTNPVKVQATERVLADQVDAAVTGVGVDSGVAEQPRGRGETVTGAENRAARALEAEPAAAYGVGIEGGVAPLDDRPGRYLIMWAAVSDGERVERGGGPVLRLPDDIAGRVRGGEELGPVLDDVLDTAGISERAGAAGVLTGHAVDRESALAHAVAGAFGPFLTDVY